jgi:hypothetical protein
MSCDCTFEDFAYEVVGTCAKIALERDFNESGLKIGQ